jgi:hypothetical protein
MSRQAGRCQAGKGTIAQEAPDGCKPVVWVVDAQRVDGHLAARYGGNIHMISLFLKGLQRNYHL